MKLRTFLVPLFIFTMVLSMTFVTTVSTTQAACSYNGYFHSGGKCSKSFKNYNYNYRKDYDDEDDDIGYNFYQYQFSQSRNDALLMMIARLQDLIKQLQKQMDGQVYTESDINVTTRAATNIDEDSATLRGTLDLNDTDEADVYFEYGTSRTNLNKDTDKETIDDNDDITNFSAVVEDLNDNTIYYYRAVGEDENNDKDYGVIYSFRTDADNTDLPDLVTGDADNVTEDEAELNGEVDMNDFENGKVFFVYGEDETQIDDVSDDYDTYSDIDEDGDDLQKELVDNDLDNDEQYSLDVAGLDNDTRIYYAICVEFEDDDDRLLCGDTESFRTDTN